MCVSLQYTVYSTHILICIDTNVYVCLCMHMYKYIWYTCVCACLYTSVCVCTYIYIHACVCRGKMVVHQQLPPTRLACAPPSPPPSPALWGLQALVYKATQKVLCLCVHRSANRHTRVCVCVCGADTIHSSIWGGKSCSEVLVTYALVMVNCMSLFSNGAARHIPCYAHCPSLSHSPFLSHTHSHPFPYIHLTPLLQTHNSNKCSRRS